MHLLSEIAPRNVVWDYVSQWRLRSHLAMASRACGSGCKGSRVDGRTYSTASKLEKTLSSDGGRVPQCTTCHSLVLDNRAFGSGLRAPSPCLPGRNAIGYAPSRTAPPCCLRSFSWLNHRSRRLRTCYPHQSAVRITAVSSAHGDSPSIDRPCKSQPCARHAAPGFSSIGCDIATVGSARGTSPSFNRLHPFQLEACS